MPEPASGDLPVVVVGDVHGDLEHLFSALRPYPADQWHTLFLGDLVDGGPFGVGALRYARDRLNSTVLVGNHEVAMLWALRDRTRIGYWVSIGGQIHDLDELRRDPDLAAWMRRLPALARLEDGSVAQHSDNDGYARLIDAGAEDVLGDVNREVGRLLESGGEETLWSLMTPRHVFRQNPLRLDSWLVRTGSFRVVHGHTPHRLSRPEVYQRGRAVNFDGGLGRYRISRLWGGRPFAASVGPLPPF
ncbi:MAG: metallophosphoesterase [Candidatus Dormibacteraceae bacterium]